MDRDRGRPADLAPGPPGVFPIKRCETLSLANNKETLGDPPSPWITAVYSEVGHPVHELARLADASVSDWEEAYSISLGGRAWVNFSSLFRLMDHWGLPHTLVSHNLGGNSSGPLDGHSCRGRSCGHSRRWCAWRSSAC